jgi:hypothetical protein
MKQAQADADELIAAYRREQQDAFDKKVAMEGEFPLERTSRITNHISQTLAFSSTGGSGGNASAKLQAETNKDIQQMQGQFQSNAQKAVDVLLSKCCEVSLEVPTARVRSTQKLYGN